MGEARTGAGRLRVRWPMGVLLFTAYYMAWCLLRFILTASTY
jgi:hypothetical protein